MRFRGLSYLVEVPLDTHVPSDARTNVVSRLSVCRRGATEKIGCAWSIRNQPFTRRNAIRPSGETANWRLFGVDYSTSWRGATGKRTQLSLPCLQQAPSIAVLLTLGVVLLVNSRPPWLLQALPYFYVVFLTILLFDRATRDDVRCREK
jgi:hypothetical protein